MKNGAAQDISTDYSVYIASSVLPMHLSSCLIIIISNMLTYSHVGTVILD